MPDETCGKILPIITPAIKGATQQDAAFGLSPRALVFGCNDSRFRQLFGPRHYDQKCRTFDPGVVIVGKLITCGVCVRRVEAMIIVLQRDPSDVILFIIQRGRS